MRISILFFVFMLPFTFSAQTQSGEIVYKIESQMDLEAMRDTLKMPEDFKRSLLKDLQKVEKVLPYMAYRLEFNEKEAVFKMDDQMPVDQGLDLDFVKGIVFKPGELYYTNAEEQISVWKNSSYDKIWLVETRFKDKDWEISNETRTIAGYECRKATTYLPPSKETNFQKRKIIAWFTPKIPLPFGPKDYVGLPGMVLGFSMGKNGGFIYADQVKLSSKKVVVERPVEGQKIGAKKYKQVMDSLFQVRMSRYKQKR